LENSRHQWVLTISYRRIATIPTTTAFQSGSGLQKHLPRLNPNRFANRLLWVCVKRSKFLSAAPEQRKSLASDRIDGDLVACQDGELGAIGGERVSIEAG
jgi:hypothetical protein